MDKNYSDKIIYIGSLLGAIGVISGWTSGIFKKFFGFLLCEFSRYKPSLPKKTITVVPKVTIGNCNFFWHLGSQGDQPGMDIRGEFTVTNITNQPIKLIGAKIKKSNVMGEIFSSSDDNILLPGLATNARIMFWIIPPLLKDKKESFIDKIALVDQYGNSHWTDKIEFKSTARS